MENSHVDKKAPMEGDPELSCFEELVRTDIAEARKCIIEDLSEREFVSARMEIETFVAVSYRTNLLDVIEGCVLLARAETLAGRKAFAREAIENARRMADTYPGYAITKDIAAILRNEILDPATQSVPRTTDPLVRTSELAILNQASDYDRDGGNRL